MNKNNQIMKTITVVHADDVNCCPPVETLVKILLDLGYYVKLIG